VSVHGVGAFFEEQLRGGCWAPGRALRRQAGCFLNRTSDAVPMQAGGYKKKNGTSGRRKNGLVCTDGSIILKRRKKGRKIKHGQWKGVKKKVMVL